MGTDMKLYVEKRVGQQWVFVPVPGLQWESIRDWSHDWYKGCYQNYDAMALICGVRNYDGFKRAFTFRGDPPEPSPELARVVEHFQVGDGHTWFIMSELLAYDFDQTVMKMCRTYSPEELVERRWSPSRDGLPREDVQRHLEGAELERQKADGYEERPKTVRSLVADLLSLMDKMREVAGVPSDQIRVSVFFW